MYPTVCQFKDQMMVVCDCHSEGVMLGYDKEDKELYLTHWTTSSNSSIFSHNIVDAFHWLFTKHDRTTRIIDIDREAMYQIASYINDSFKLKKKIKKEPQTKISYSQSFYVNCKDNRRIVINFNNDDGYTFSFEHPCDINNRNQWVWKTFWRILTKGTSGVNYVTVEDFEVKMFLDFMIDCLQYQW